MNPIELDTQLCQQLPPWYREVLDYQQLCQTETAQFEALAQEITGVADNFFFQTMDLSGQVLDYSAAGNYWALLTGSALTIYTSTGQEPYALLESLQGARYVDLSRDGSALLASAQQAWLYLPN